MTVDEPSADEDFGVDIATDLEISALANDQLVKAPSTVSVREAAALMDAEGIGLLILEDDDGNIAGVVSERDILKAVGSGTDLDGSATSVGKGQTIKRAAPTSTVGEVAEEMMENYIRHILITDPDGDVTGIVSIRDLLAVIVTG